MTTQVLTLVAPAPASAPTATAAQPSPEADSFASVLASQHEVMDNQDGAADSLLPPPSHSTRDKHTSDAQTEVAEREQDDTDAVLSMIASTLFIAAESASIQQGLRAQTTNKTSIDNDTLGSQGHTNDKPLQRSALVLNNGSASVTNQAIDTRETAMMPLTRTLATSADDSVTTRVDANNAAMTTPQPALSKNSSTATLLQTSSMVGKTMNVSVADNVKAVLATLPAAAQTQAMPSVDSLTATQDVPVVTTAIANAAQTITTLAAPSSAPVLQSALNQPLDSPTWGQEFSKTMLTFSRQGIQHAELRLDPPELGPLRISLKLSDNIAHAYIVSAHANVRQAVEQALPQLQQALAQSGLSLGQTDVSDQPSDQGFFAQQQSDGYADSASSNRFEDLLHGRSAPTEAAAPPVRRAIPDALVDTFA